MAETLPQDLIDLQRAFQAAHQRVLDYVTERQGAAWTAADDDRLDGLRAEREAARKAAWAHPEHAAILAGGRWSALKKAAREDAQG